MDKRLDVLIFEKMLAKSREAAKELIKNNQIFVDGKIIWLNHKFCGITDFEHSSSC